mgnify:CR=1 FL=1
MGGLNFRAFGFEIGCLISIRKERKEPVDAVTNRCIDGKYIVFLDYDNRELEWVVDEVEYLQEMYDLSTAYIFNSSKNSYHVITFDKLCYTEYLQLLNESSVDPHYRKIPFTFGKRVWTLRNSAKNGQKPIPIISLRRDGSAIQSQAHKDFFTNIYPKADFYDLSLSDGYGGEDSIIYAKYYI